MSRITHHLFIKAGLIQRRGHKRYILRPHSLRKYFRTQLTAKGVPADIVEYMMGHKLSTYLDIRMKGVEFLRNIYAAAGLNIKPKNLHQPNRDVQRDNTRLGNGSGEDTCQGGFERAP